MLIVAVIHEERLIGHEQYWLTRPYTWKNLVAAKALFPVVFVSLPLFVCQYIILAAIRSVPANWVAALEALPKMDPAASLDTAGTAPQRRGNRDTIDCDAIF